MSFPVNKILLATCCFAFLIGPAYGQEDIQLIDPLVAEQSQQTENSLVSLTSPEAKTDNVLAEGNLPSGQATMDDMLKRLEMNASDVDVYQIPSLFFDAREHSLLVEARQGFVTRPPGEDELQQAENGNVVMGPRTLSLGGIVYVASNDWVVWLNGQRISANAIPSEILDINVTKSYVKLQWFDEYTNQIFPVKLRAHQRFNIDTRIFLPG